MMKLIDLIAEFTAPDVFNPWRDADDLDAHGNGPELRRERLCAHFDCEPEFLLLGEAPGYQGCRFSGVPFTNESLLLKGLIPRIDLRNTRISARPKPWCEPSATIVWDHLHRLGVASKVVMWNAFGWHPHRAGEPMSNRAPTQAELRIGIPVLKAILNHFESARVIAVGKTAEKALQRACVESVASVRHPSRGGANLFREQMTQLVSR